MLFSKIRFIVVVVLFMLFSLPAIAQNDYYSEYNRIHFGFSLGMNSMDFGIKPSLQTIDGKVYQVDVSRLKPGFSVGIISDMQLSRYFNLRFTPTLHFGERELSYHHASGDTTYVSVGSTLLCFPLYLKYSAERYGNLRPYLIGGGGVSIDLGRDKEKPVYLKPLDVYLEFGVGCDIYFWFFKLAPELKFAIGGNNLFVPFEERNGEGTLINQDKKYSQALSKLTSKMITLTFNFE
ncbi:MAG: PorT family protein [Bacteroidales bacterium]|nr:PorT family protein [Bacteroidales bacterium]